MKKKYESSPLWWWFFVSNALVTLAVLGFYPGLAINPLMVTAVRWTFLIICVLHLVEAIYAYWLASQNNLKEVAFKWFLHTLVCGIMAIFKLQKVIKENAGL